MMSDAEKLMQVLTIIAIVLVMVILGLILVAIFIKKKNEKQENIVDSDLERNNKESQNRLEYNAKSIFDFMDFEKIEDNMIIQKKGKYLMVLECQGVNYDLMSDMERTSVEQGFIQFLNTLRTEIQIYVQTRTVNLEDSILSYKEKFREIEEAYAKTEFKYNEMKRSGKYSDLEMQKVYFDLVKQKNKYEYTKDIIANTERNSLNSTVLHKKYYIIVPAYEDELITENFSKDEIQSMVFSELYTKARSIARTLSRCEVNAKILDSEGLIDLLYVAYNRDESDLFSAKRALQAGFEDLYTTAPDVIDRKIKLLDKQIEEEAAKLATEAINEARSDKEMLLRIREQNRENLIYDFADSLIDENESYIGEDVSADAKAKIKMKRNETKEGGKKDAKEKKSTRGRKSVNK